MENANSSMKRDNGANCRGAERKALEYNDLNENDKAIIDKLKDEIMGSMSKLKDKETYRYRKGSTNEAVNCRACKHFRVSFPIFGLGGDGTPIRIESRCDLLGLKESIRYRVRPDYTCDRQKTSQVYDDSLMRMRGRWAGTA